MQSKHHCREKPYTTAGGQACRGVKKTPDKKIGSFVASCVWIAMKRSCLA
nr:MAG TPA: hypothetical protein [Caudoviricetes sp.]